jgi:protoporphyrinogen oxidase
MSVREKAERLCVIVGAGPAGLTAAYELSKLEVPAVLLERDSVVGGISKTGSFRGYHFDIGGHRFFTKVDFVQDLWVEILGADFLERPRMSRIYYDGKFFDYPIKPVNALFGLGLLESVRIGASYLRALAFPKREERTFEQWIVNRFGQRLFELFFKSYTEKVWGIPCSDISADWAAQRIKQLDLVTAIKKAVLGARRGPAIDSLLERFHYPRLGPGMMWSRCCELLAERGYETHLETEVRRIHHHDSHVTGVTVRDRSGEERFLETTDLISSMPIRELVNALEPAAPADVVDAANQLGYRDFLSVLLIIDEADLFPDNWIYIHSPEVRLGRVQNFKNWSPDMVPDPSTTSLGLEYFVEEGDELWSMPDRELIAFALKECSQIGLVDSDTFIDGTVVRVLKAYPIYDEGYQSAVASIRSYLDEFENIQLVGRNGQHRYNNQDHSMVTAIYAAQNLAGADHVIWSVNVDGEYHENERSDHAKHRDRAVPSRVHAENIDELIRAAFARYDPIALSASLAITLGVGLFLATMVPIAKDGIVTGPPLALFGDYLPGFAHSWTGAFLGLLEGAFIGGAFGYGLARSINAVVEFHERRFLRAVELDVAFSGVERRQL